MLVVAVVVLNLQEQEFLVEQVVEDKVVLEQVMQLLDVQTLAAAVVAVVITLHLKPEEQVVQV